MSIKEFRKGLRKTVLFAPAVTPTATGEQDHNVTRQREFAASNKEEPVFLGWDTSEHQTAKLTIPEELR